MVSIIECIPTPEAKEQAKPSSDRSWAPYHLYNIGNHRPVELLYFIELIERYTNRKAIRVSLPMQPGDVPITYADVTKLTEATGFCPHTSIEDGLREFIAWYRGYYGL